MHAALQQAQHPNISLTESGQSSDARRWL